MTQEIKNLYEIRFENRIVDYFITGKKIVKVPDANNEYLSDFLFSYGKVEEMGEVFESLNEALTNPNIKAEHGVEIMTIYIYQDKVDFYTADDGFVYRIPTNDFRQIFEGWRDFLLTPPFNRSRYTGK